MSLNPVCLLGHPPKNLVPAAFTLLVAAVAAAPVAPAAAEETAKSDPAVEAVVERQERLDRFACSGRVVVQYDPPAEHAAMWISGRFGYDFLILHDGPRYVHNFTRVIAEPANDVSESAFHLLRQFVSNGERVEQLTVATDDARHAKIGTDFRPPFFAAVDLVLGVRLKPSDRYAAPPAVWRRMRTVEVDGDDRLVFEERGEGTTRRWFWSTRTSSPQLQRVDSVLHTSGELASVMEMSDFREVDGLQIPGTFTIRNGPQSAPTITLTGTIETFSLDDRRLDVEEYHMEWPAETTVLDERINFVFVTDPDKARVYTDADIFRLGLEDLELKRRREAEREAAGSADD